MTEHKLPAVPVALLPIAVLVVMALLSISVWDIDMVIPLMSAVIVTVVIGKALGYTWRELEQSMVRGVSRALPAVFILFLIGMIIGTWIEGGLIPTIIYYGLTAIWPVVFLPLACLVPAIVSLVLGTSLTTIATVGIAFIAIGQGMGFHPALVAGAVISGAFFGDKLSPLSDTTNLAAAMGGVKLFDHIRHMLWDTIPALVIALAIYAFIGWPMGAEGSVGDGEVTELLTALDAEFVIHPLLLIVPVIAIGLMLIRVPALLTLLMVALLGAATALIVQGSSLTEVMQSMSAGIASETGVEFIDSLLSRGGVAQMLSTIALVVVATALGGILEKTGAFKSLVGTVVRRVKRPGSMVATSMGAGFTVAISSGEQYVSVLLPARAFLGPYQKMGLAPVNLTRVAEAAGTVGINLVPWSVPAVFAADVFGLSPLEFIPFVFFAMLVPVINLIYAYTGFSIKRIDPRDNPTEVIPSSDIDVSQYQGLSPDTPGSASHKPAK
ncbi:Na+/H+ antiporter NhaC [Auritidibacter ignavus]|uniref:Na+/H+ antiporter NhaC n=1 Tax=Auritidibacter ignavus TaxID=678932 RepID=UPI00244ACF40|nr:Na+/H+ antiporter NhaC [Auritidibacter ignavus]WGH83631.1 Na+/H+ antiporter NhaC [Auritidibacter ignavus]